MNELKEYFLIKDGKEDLTLLFVKNYDSLFNTRLREIISKWQESDVEFYKEILTLEKYGYKIEFVDYEEFFI